MISVPGTSGEIHKQMAFYDVNVFNPFAKSNQKFRLASCFNHHERSKKRSYEQRIVEIDNGSFTSLVFSSSGSMGCAATIFYQRPAHLLAEKRNQPYSATMGWLRCHLGLSWPRSSILCIRGSRSRPQFIPQFPDSTELSAAESHTPISPICYYSVLVPHPMPISCFMYL